MGHGFRVIFVFVFVMMIGFAIWMFGGAYGFQKGVNLACESIGLEWEKNKCIKVTREWI